MPKIIIENRLKPKMHTYVDGNKVGEISPRRPFAVDVTVGEHRLNISFPVRGAEAVEVPLHVPEGARKQIRIIATKFALRMGRWLSLVVMLAMAALAFVVTRRMSGGQLEPVPQLVASGLLFVMLVFFWVIEMKKKKNPGKFIEIEVIDSI